MTQTEKIWIIILLLAAVRGITILLRVRRYRGRIRGWTLNPDYTITILTGSFHGQKRRIHTATDVSYSVDRPWGES